LEIAPEAIEITRPGERAEARGLTLRLERWGRGEALDRVAPAIHRAEGPRTELARGPIVEWYVNDARGVEQGFTIAAAPEAAEPAPLCLQLAVEGGYDVEILAGERDACFTSPIDGTVVHYRGLRAWDATERELAARLEAEEGCLTIAVEDDGAAYPVTVDPWIWAEQAKLLAAGGSTGDSLGQAVAIDGETAIVGAHMDGPGTAWIFTRSGTVWSQEARLIASDGGFMTMFGWSAALDADTALVGSPWAYGPSVQSGAAYAFARTGTTWSQQAKLLPLDPVSWAGFGTAVATDGDRAFVGATSAYGAASGSGAVYVFERSGTTWSQVAKLDAADGAPLDGFGSSLSLLGDTLVIGAVGDDDHDLESGSVYVFERSGSSWTQQAKLTASDGARGDNLGSSVSLDGDTLLVGAEGYGGGLATGAAYVFERSGSTWVEQAKLTACIAVPNSYFGHSVSLSGDTGLVGAMRDDELGAAAGAAYLYARTESTWNLTAKLTPPSGDGGEQFGSSVVLTPDTAVIGAIGDDTNGPGAGAAHVFVRHAAAAAVFRNDAAGMNIPFYYASAPVLGGTWDGRVDNNNLGGRTMAWVAGFTEPLDEYVPALQSYLLVDPTSPGGELLQFPPTYGTGVVTFFADVPSDAALAGFTLSTQGMSFGGGTFWPLLLNAYDLFVGY